MKVKICVIAFVCIAQAISVSAHTITPDSTGVEITDGKKVITVKVEPKDNYFSIARRFKVSPKAIMDYNKNAKLVPGMVIKVPVEPVVAPAQAVPSAAAETQPEKPAIEKKMAVDTKKTVVVHKVVKGETLFSIAKHYNTKVADIVAENGLKSDKVALGQHLKITTNGQTTPQETVTPVPAPVTIAKTVPTKPTEAPLYKTTATVQPVVTGKPPVTEQIIEKPEVAPVKHDSSIFVAAKDSIDANGQRLQANKFGLYEKTEKGVGIWMSDDNLDAAKKLILHRTAPVGTVIKITNPMTNRTTFAKVVGRFTENANTKDVIIVMTKSVAEALGALDQRFHVILSYGSPNE